MKLNLYFDGAARPNPGPAACAAVLISDDSKTVCHVGSALGTATNNVAEWTGLEIGLAKAAELGAREVAVFGDSQLVINQAFGTWTIGEERLRTIAQRVKALAANFSGIVATHIPAGKNAAADTVCNAVLDGEYIGFDAPCTGMMSNLTFVTHVFVDADRYAGGPARNQLRKRIEDVVRDHIPVAQIAVKRTAAHTVPVANGIADLSFAIRLGVSANAGGSPEQRAYLHDKLRDRLAHSFPGALLTRVCA